MTKTAILAAFIAMLAGSATTASAAIRCDGDYQIVNGMEIATPFCETDNLARNARRHGLSVSTDTLRSDNEARVNACNLAGASKAVCGDLAN